MDIIDKILENVDTNLDFAEYCAEFRKVLSRSFLTGEVKQRILVHYLKANSLYEEEVTVKTAEIKFGNLTWFNDYRIRQKQGPKGFDLYELYKPFRKYIKTYELNKYLSFVDSSLKDELTTAQQYQLTLMAQKDFIFTDFELEDNEFSQRMYEIAVEANEGLETAISDLMPLYRIYMKGQEK